MDTGQTAGLSAAKRALLDATLRGHARAPAPARHARGAEAPLSFAQERLWFLDRLGQGGAAYTVAAAVRLPGELDAAALERALGEVVRRHEALRTTFRETDGVPLQVIHPFAGFPLALDDLRAAGDAEAEARRTAEAEAAQAFDLVAGPLFRARLLRLPAREHMLLLSLHHIVADGWSMQVLSRELWTLYRAFRDGGEGLLPELPVQYADVAVRQREEAGGPGEAAHLAYWKAQLAGAPELLELPADRPRPPVPSFRGGSVPVEVAADRLERLRALARAENATLFMVVLAAFQLLLSRWSGSDDVVVGTLSAGRTREETEGLIGLFMNTLVLRTDLSGDPDFRTLVGRVRERVLGAYEHQDVPFERVVAEVQPERSLSHSTLFQVVFQLDAAEVAASGGGVRGMETGSGATKFDLSLLLHSHPRGVGGVLEYSADLFERGTARRMVEHLDRVLEQVGADPGRRLSRLRLMGTAERARVLAWNRTTAAFPADRCIHHLFEAQAARTPEAPAVTCAGRSLTYRELDARANRVAHHLRRLGVGPEGRVAVWLERGPELLPAILGVMKAGGAYVPLDPGFPDERVAYVLGDSGASVLLTHARLAGRLPTRQGVAVVDVDGAWDGVAAGPAEAPETGVGPENLCYVIYTSGSTGRPKGVAMHHRGVCNYLHWGARFYGAGEGGGAPVFTSMAVDLTITNLLPLFAGRTVHLLPEASPVEHLAAVLREKPRFGLIKITPIHLGLLNAMLAPGEAAAAAHTLVVGADFLSAEPTVFWQEHAPGVRLVNEYGPTETVVGCSAYLLPRGKHRAGAVPVGHPIQNLAFYVLDAHLHPVPVGLPGELHIGGVGVARGYLGRPGLTGEKFVPDPFAAPGARMYRTGDRARWLADGNLVILGRTDHQVKIRGYRVELGEVEAALRRQGAREALALVREDRPGDRRLAAYVVADGGADPAALREALRQSLPEYMVPDAIVVLAALPHTPTGKIDRKTLPAPDWHAAGTGEVPQNETEATLVHIWEELLGVEGISPTDGFFRLGGNSLLALRLFAQANRIFDCDLPVSTLFSGATVRHMARAVDEQKRSGRPELSPVVPLRPAGTLPPLWCVHPADRRVFGYVGIGRYLGAGQPLYGLRDVGEDLARPLHRMAAEYVDAVRTVQPHGPYYLAGWSFGGLVAYEMALRFEASGEPVAFVGLLDTMAPAMAEDWPYDRDPWISVSLAEDVAARMNRPFSFDVRELEGVEPDEQLRRVVGSLRAQGAAPMGFGPEGLAEQCALIRARNRSKEGYLPGPFGGTLTVFLAGEVPPRYHPFFARYPEAERRTLGWSRYVTAPVQVLDVPGAHASIGAEPHVRVLAEQLKDALAAARARPQPIPTPAGTHG